MLHFLCLITWIWISLISASARADALSWQACVELAARGNPEVRAARATLEATAAQEGVARSGFFPGVSGSLGYTNGATNSAIATHTYAASLSVSQNLFSGLSDQARVAQAAANTTGSGESLRSVKAKVSYDLKSAFEGLLYAREYADLTQDITSRRTENLRLVDLRFESGRENKGSVLLSRAYLEQARYDDLQAKHGTANARIALARTLGQDDAPAIEITGRMPLVEPADVDPDFRALASETPDLRLAAAQENAAEAGISVARAGYFPSLALSGTAGRQGPDFFPESERWSLGLNLTVPILNGGKDFYSTRAAREGWISAASGRENVDRTTQSKLAQAYHAYVEAVAKLKVDDSFRQAALTRAEIARKKYNNGLLTFEDWDVIENDLISRQKAYLTSRRDRAIAEAAWEQAQGKGVIP
jgi:outer membrane protein TolC